MQDVEDIAFCVNNRRQNVCTDHLLVHVRNIESSLCELIISPTHIRVPFVDDLLLEFRVVRYAMLVKRLYVYKQANINI